MEYAKRKDFTAIINVHTNRREPGKCLLNGRPGKKIFSTKDVIFLFWFADALVIINFPDGLTAHLNYLKFSGFCRWIVYH